MLDRLSRLRRLLRPFSVALVVFALAARLGSGTVVVNASAMSDVAALAALSIRCDTSASVLPPGHERSADHAPTADIQVLAAWLSLWSPTPTPAPPVPVRRQVAILCAVTLPGIREPPTATIAAAWPRGPPNQA